MNDILKKIYTGFCGELSRQSAFDFIAFLTMAVFFYLAFIAAPAMDQAIIDLVK